MERAPSCVLSLIGLPGSGKTQLSQSLKATQCSLSDGKTVAVHHVCFDAFLEEALSSTAGNEAAFTPEAWQASRVAAFQHVLELLRSSQGKALHLIVLDDNMQYRSMRNHCFQLARYSGAAYAQLFVDCPQQLCFDRNAGREAKKKVPAATIERMAAAMERPVQRHASGAVLTSELNGHTYEDCTLVISEAEDPDQASQRVWQWLDKVWAGAPARPPNTQALRDEAEQARKVTAASALHRLDLLTRAKLSSSVAQVPRACRGQIAQRLNASRQDILAEARVMACHVERCFHGAQEVLFEMLEDRFSNLCSAAVDAQA